MKKREVILLALLCGALGQTRPEGPATGPAAVVQETAAQKDARMHWWREARFGLFIHWGLYAVPAGVYQGKPVPDLGEWIMNNASIPVNTYAAYAKAFNPTKFNAEQWVEMAKAAGMKYIVITAKHHDGFAMFKSQDPFNIVDATPYGKDPIAELAAACRKAGLHFGVYYSQSQDWHHAGGYAYGRDGRKNGDHWDAAQAGSFDDYLQGVAIPQVRELLTQYQPDVLWWDTSGPMTREEAGELHALLGLRPGVITNNRLGGGFKGDTETPEQRIPVTGFADGRDFEVCMTINGTWGYKSTDVNFKSTQTLLRNLVDIASKGGNYLLNVGPTAAGEIPQPEVERLAAIGAWLKVNGESIYATGPNPFPAAAVATSPATLPATSRPRTPPVVWDWRATTKPGRIYIHLLTWPASQRFTVPGPVQVLKAYLLADPEKALEVVPVAGGLSRVTLPAVAPDALDTVLVLQTR